MYIFELIYEYFKTPKYKRKNYNPLNNYENGLEINEEDCNHCFLPLDASNEYFACKYCGMIVSKDNLKDINIFRNFNKKTD